MTACLSPVVSAPICPYCKRASEFLPSSARLYDGRNFGPIWICWPCRSWVGVHKGTTVPLGRLADRELRRWKSAVHQAFDPIWKERYARRYPTDPKYTKAKARNGHYKALAVAMGIPRAECHVGEFDIERCQQAIAVIKSGALDEASAGGL